MSKIGDHVRILAISQGGILYQTPPDGVISMADEKVKISAVDALSGYLTDKLQEGSGVVISEVDVGGNKHLVISATGEGTTDHNLLTNRDLADQHPIAAITDFTLAQLNAQLTDGDLDLDSADRNDGQAIHKAVPSEIAVITAKGTPVGADVLLMEDSENANAKRSRDCEP